MACTMKLRSALLAVPALLLVACAADSSGDPADPSAAPGDEQDITSTATGVSLEASDNGATFAVEEGKKILVQLTYGGFVASPYGAYEVTSTDRSLGYPKITTKTPRIPDAPVTQKLVWQTGGFSHAGETHKVVLTAKSLNGGKARTFAFTAKIVAKASSGAKNGAMCGGIAGLACASGLDCIMSGAEHPDQSGTCRARNVGAAIGAMCGGFAGLRCQDGLECQIGAKHPDAAGSCVLMN
jgi:hypothetical protein